MNNCCNPNCQIQSLWKNIHRLSREIANIETGSGSTQISVGTVETVDVPYLTITGNPTQGYIINIGFPQSGSSTDNYKGEFDTVQDLTNAASNPVLNDYGYIQQSNSFWYYSPTLEQFINQEVTASQYMAYPEAVREEINFIIIPG